MAFSLKKKTPRFVLSLDLGTTGVRALLYRSNGNLTANSYRTFSQHYPQPGWVEHDPEEIFQAVLQMIRRTCRMAACSFSDIASVGITNQRETVVMWNKNTARPVARAIVWQDRRTEDFCEALKKKRYEKLIRNKTGLVLDPYFSATKIRWILNRIAGVREQAAQGNILFGTMDTWILWRLTGKHATDFTNASRTLIFNIHRRNWDSQLLKIFGIPKNILPEVLPSGGFFGKTLALPGIHPGVPVYAMMGDQQAALYGQHCVNPGEAKNTYGTGCFMMMNAGKKKPRLTKGILTTLAVDEKGQPSYAFEGAVFIGGAVVQWLRDEMQLIKTAEETEKLALSVSDTHGMTLIPAFVGLGSPHWRSDIRGTIFGLTRGVTKAHFARAALESIAQQSADVLEAMRKASGVPIRELRADGKAALNRFLMQYQANLTNLKILASSQAEVTAWGAARLAGEMIGFWDQKLDQGKVLSYQTYMPTWTRRTRQRKRAEWQKRVAQLLVLRQG